MTRDDRRLPKLCGADIELGNFVLGLDRPGGTAREASRALLREIDAPYDGGDGRLVAPKGYDPQDWGRRYLDTNGGCFYVDLDHLECCLPEVLSAHDHVAAWHAMLRIAGQALERANRKLPSGQRIQVLVNNSDGKGNAYGSHLSFLVSRRTWDNVFERKMHQLLFLAAFQISSIVFTGQGKVGAENGMPDVAFQLAQRADFFETLVGPQTTSRRPIVNGRDEALCGIGFGTDDAPDYGPAAEMARLHCIFFDNTLCHGSSLLKVGTMQLILGLLEAERVNPMLLVDDPVTALVRWSHDPGLNLRARMVSGERLTAIELQLRFLEEAQRFASAGGYDGIVPRAGEILALWEDTLAKLAAGDLAALTGRLDWVLKLHVLRHAMASRPELRWTGPEIKHLDHLYASLDRDGGLYWAYEAAGEIERLVSDSEIERFVHEPPPDTRAWGRAMLLRLARDGQVQDVDWDRIRFRQAGRGYWPTLRTIHMANPLGFTRALVGHVVERAGSLDGALQALGASTPTDETTPSLLQWRQANGHTEGEGR